MRALMMVAALCCAMMADAAAQPRQEATPRDRVQGNQALAPAVNPTSLQNACIITEFLSAPPTFFPPTSQGGHTHSFFLRNDGDSDTYRIDVTEGGLRLNSATQTAGSPGSLEADTRFAAMIDLLRAAAASRSKFRIDARNQRVTQVIVAWNQRCPGN